MKKLRDYLTIKIGDVISLKSGLESGKYYGGIKYYEGMYFIEPRVVKEIDAQGMIKLIGDNYYYSPIMLEQKKEYKLYLGDALEVMDKLIKEGIKVDAVITDIPYGTTGCKWDSIIPFEAMWERLNRIVKDDNTPILLFGQQPFTSELIVSNIKNFKYQWYYKKRIASNFASAKYQPMKHIEDICVFTKNGKTANYYPIKQPRSSSGKARIKSGFTYNSEVKNETMGNMKRNVTKQEYDKDLKYPENIQEFNNRAKGARGSHPTQKPIELLEYLVKTYTKETEIVLDFTMGSGTTGIASLRNNRKFIGIEMDETYLNVAKDRIKKGE